MIDKTQLKGWIREYCQSLNREIPGWMENNPKKFREILRTVKETQEYTRIRDAIKLLHSGRNLLRFHLKDESSLRRIWDGFLKEIFENEPEVLLQNIDERFEKWKKIEEVGKGLITEALSFYYPKHFAPWNNTVEWYFKEFGWGRPNSYSTVLNRLNELRMLFKEVCEDDPDFIMVDHFGWWLKHQLSTQGFEELIGLLRREKEKFSTEWQKEGLPVINEMRNIVDEFIAFKRPDLEPPFPINNKDVEKLLWFIKGGVSSEVDLEKVREYIIELKETDKSNSKTVIEKYWKKIPGVGPTGMITIAALVYPDTFMPLWGSPKDSRGVINPRTFRLLGVDKNAYRLGLNEYLSVIERVRSAAVNVGIDNLFEAAFYLIKYGGGGDEMPQANTAPVEGRNLFYETSGVGLAEYFCSKGYSFPNYLIAQFYTALKTKGFVILSGLSGTGKTKIALEFAKLLKKKEKINFPQLLTAWGSKDPEQKFECAINWIKELISKNGYVILAWDDSDTIRNVSEPFILWIGYKSGVRYGFIISRKYPKEEVLNNPALKEKIKKGFEWSIELFDSLETELYKNKIFLETTKVVELNKKLSYNRFVKIDSGKQLKGIPQKWYSKVKILEENVFTGTKSYIFLPVRPDWRDSKPLLGYYNPLTGEYHKTPLLEFILKAEEDYEKNRENAMPYFIILDEMNLAHVEYYFADFLSVLESGRDEDGFTREPLRLHDVDEIEEKQGIPKELKLPPNLYIIGTVNMDETTYSFSPKVLDRAFTIEFHDVELEEYPPTGENIQDSGAIEALRDAILKDLRGRDGQFLARPKERMNKAVKEFKDANNGKYWEILNQLNNALEPYDLHFGYRVVDEIALFFQNAKESRENKIVEFESEDEIFDLALLMKVLPKFHGNRKKLDKPLKVILAECLRRENNAPVKFRVSFTEGGNTRTLELPTDIDKLNSGAIIEMLTNWNNYENNFLFKHTARKVLRMLRQLYEIGFASFS